MDTTSSEELDFNHYDRPHDARIVFNDYFPKGITPRIYREKFYEITQAVLENTNPEDLDIALDRIEGTGPILAGFSSRLFAPPTSKNTDRLDRDNY